MVKNLREHLAMLEHNKIITFLDIGSILPGAEWHVEMDKYLKEAHIILLLISASFIASDFGFKVQIQEAIARYERHEEVSVIPVILRPTDWEYPPLDKLRPLPKNAKPISMWRSQDAGFVDVARGIGNITKLWGTSALPGPTTERRRQMANLDQLIETVKQQMQPEDRAIATSKTLWQLSVLMPIDVTLADLIVGWQILARPAAEQEPINIERRRITCGELATLASPFAVRQGRLSQAIKTWQAWQNAFDKSDDPRQATMAATFARELAELQAHI
jgi:hypothetical protein